MKIAKDKSRHFYAGIVMGAALQLFFSYLLNDRQILSIILSLFFSTVIAYGFELFSKFTGKGYYEVMDAVATVIGSVLGIALAILIQLL